jgi:hypothetical protein
MVLTLSRGTSPGDLVEHLNGRRDLEGTFTSDDVRTVPVGAARRLRDVAMLPPVEAGFLRQTVWITPGVTVEEAIAHPRPLSASDLPELRALAAERIEGYLAEGRDLIDPSDPELTLWQSIALQFAAALVRQDETIAAMRKIAADPSSLEAQLTGTDRVRIDGLHLKGNDGWHLWTLDGSLHSWEHFVGGLLATRPELEVWEPYESHLQGRDGLEDIVSLLSPVGREPFEARLRPADERFLASTRGVSEPIRTPEPWEPRRWWWYRVPLRLGEHFAPRLWGLAPAAAREAADAEAREDAASARASDPDQ